MGFAALAAAQVLEHAGVGGDLLVDEVGGQEQGGGGEAGHAEGCEELGLEVCPHVEE
jgi:hypothetical protein